MGWCHEDGTHEGYLVALVFDDDGLFLGHAGYPPAPTKARRKKLPHSGRLRELGTRRDVEANATVAVRFVKAACACGWRSTLLHAPDGVEWLPSTVFAPEWFEDAARAFWAKHADECGAALDGGLYLRPQHSLKDQRVACPSIGVRGISFEREPL